MQQGHQVIALDNFSSGVRANLQHWVGNPRYLQVW